MRYVLIAGWLLLAPVLIPGPGAPLSFAQSPSGPAEADPSPEVASPEVMTAIDFVKEVAASDQVEIESSQIALERGTSVQQAFAKQMIDSHGKTSADLKRLVSIEKIAVDLPVELGDGDRARLDKLKLVEAAKFIGEYSSLQVVMHRNAVALFERYAKDGDNMSLKAWARRTLPVLRHDLAAAEKLPRS
ncbi:MULTISPECIES: DUF4142 domain-containing protein [unclassified Beijerinckia]|uniref:DUF4142 domain-containing protein n=1 Tax=unclassified Beijerinckia TaxID=2638183 RepID=UPI00089CD18B|nr:MULTISPECIES: DUF4142 domain-containing protein [unclassified Beijerinckia]MDH7798346.1 putative membrane protein [Beijerinckia sp. GAS462]SED17880.1 putative membrane protein [Beijerinckia sp. 28-YEA-48]